MYLKIIFILSFLLLFGCSPLHLSESKESIREQILKSTPIGMRFDEVEKVIKQKNIANRVEYDPTQIALPGTLVSIINGIQVTKQQWPGGTVPNGGCIGGTLGSSAFWEEAVGFWGFDKDKRLLDVFVFKHYNGL